MTMNIMRNIGFVECIGRSLQKKLKVVNLPRFCSPALFAPVGNSRYAHGLGGPIYHGGGLVA
jgi:hypothetical protein